MCVLAFHLQVSGARGGFLGVSLFFTLSGYLITHLILAEHARSGRVDLRAFWGRRLRRLMPGALVVIVSVAVAALAFDKFPSLRLRGDLAAALGYAANWRFMSASTSYADLFRSTPSPVLHFWSLAIEEQFYFVYPLVLVGLIALRRRAAVAAGLVTLLVCSVVSGLVWNAPNIVYYGTHTRAGELLVGALTALWFPLGGWPATQGSRRSRRSTIVPSLVFAVAVVVFAGSVATVETSDSWLYSGGLAAFSLVSVALIVAAQSPGPVRWILQRRWLVVLGGYSYGLYLFHWPIFLLVTARTVRVDGWWLNIARLGITGVVTWVSATFIEQPIRRRRLFASGRTSVLVLVSALVASVAIVVTVPRTPGPSLAGLDTPEGFVQFGEERAPEVKILVAGSATTLGSTVESALGSQFSLDLVDATSSPCTTPTECSSPDLATLIATNRPDIVIVGFSTADREQVLTTVGPLTPDDPKFFDATAAYVNAVLGQVSTTPVIVVDASTPDVMTAYLQDADLRLTNVTTLVSPRVTDIAATVSEIRAIAAGSDDRKRVMVIGDSTSYGVSVAIHDLDGERINVLWAGGQNCPVVQVQAVKWWEGVEFDLQRCPTLDAQWQAAVESFQPDVVVVAVSVPEQAEQKYPGDPEWYAPGSERYIQVHQEFITRFTALLQSRGVTLVVLDSPPIHGGALGGAPFAQPDRIAAWNAVIDQWALQWPELVVVDWAVALAAFEPEPGSLRADGVHLAQADLDRLVRTALLPIVTSILGFAPVSPPTTTTSLSTTSVPTERE